jgi:hypothetical protein
MYIEVLQKLMERIQRYTILNIKNYTRFKIPEKPDDLATQL